MARTVRNADVFGPKVKTRPTRTRVGCKNLIRNITIEELEN
jgi:hypothetical protein